MLKRNVCAQARMAMFVFVVFSLVHEKKEGLRVCARILTLFSFVKVHKVHRFCVSDFRLNIRAST